MAEEKTEMFAEVVLQAKKYFDAGLEIAPTFCTVGKYKRQKWHQKKDGNGKRIPWSWDELEYEFQHSESGIAIFAGTSLNLEILDIEYEYLFSEIIEKFPELSRYPIVKTPSDGFHIYWRSNSSHPSKKLAHDADGNCLVETRGEGGYVLAPGGSDQAHYLDRPYELISGNLCDIPQISTLLRTNVIEFCKEQNELPEQEFKAAAEKPKDGKLRLAEQWDQIADWEALLTRNGWKLAHAAGTESSWVRPNKSPSEGSSASLNHDGSNRLYIFSTGAVGFSVGPYRPSQFRCVAEFAGDWSKLIDCLKSEMAPKIIPDPEFPEFNPDDLKDLPEIPIDNSPLFPPHLPSGKYEDLASKFLDHYYNNNNYPIYIGSRIYLYEGNRYVECDEIKEVVRNFFRKNNIKQTETIVREVTAIVKNSVWKDVSKTGSMPFWDEKQKPFEASNIIAFQNCLLDTSNDQTIKHNPRWCSTNCLPFDFDQKAECKMWLNFLNEVFEDDQEKINLLQEWFGYCLTGDNSYQKAMMFFGKSRSGKTVIQSILSCLVGEENATGLSLSSLATEFGLATLINKNVAIVGEVELAADSQRARIVEVLKNIIGNNAVDINAKYEAAKSLRLNTKFTLATNTTPRLMDSSGALANRLLFLPFEVSFLGKEDFQLENKLKKELAGIAIWALNGLKRLNANRCFSLGSSHHKMVETYLQNTSPVLAWLKNTMLVNKLYNPGDIPDTNLTNDDVYVVKEKAYRLFLKFVEENDISTKKTLSFFGTELKELIPKLRDHGREQIQTADGRKAIYRGIGEISPVSEKELLTYTY